MQARAAVGALIVFGGFLFVRSSKTRKTSRKSRRYFRQRLGWLSRHVDAVCVLVILAFSTIFFINLGSGHLVAADEQTYSQWTFHMIKTGDYFTPWAFGSLFWLGKPPLVMWLMSLSYQIFGVTNFAARFWSPIFGALSLVVIYYLGKETLQPLRRLPVSPHLGVIRNILRLFKARNDRCPAGFLHLGHHLLLCFKRKRENHALRYAALSGLFFGLALMTKQIEALLVPLIIFFYLVGDKEKPAFSCYKAFTLFWGVGLLVFSPWLIYMAARFGSPFWQWYFVYNVCFTVSRHR